MGTFKKVLIRLPNPSHTVVFTFLSLILCLGKNAVSEGLLIYFLKGIKIFIRLKLLQKYMNNKYCYLAGTVAVIL